jgi:hypothetical protein
MMATTVQDYRPSPTLDAELAGLVFEALRGWPDQAPVTPAVVRSALRPTGTVATTLVLGRSDDALLGFAAIRWPEALDAVGHIWGPMVHPAAQGDGLAGALLDTVSKLVSARPGVRVRTAPIPVSRTHGLALFERAGWLGTGTSTLLRRALSPADHALVAPSTVRAAQMGEFLDQPLTQLISAARPEIGYATARDTFARWAADSRYSPAGLLLAEGAHGLAGVALVYRTAPERPQPLGRSFWLRSADAVRALPGSDEPPEARLVDLVTDPAIAPTEGERVRQALVTAAILVGLNAGAAVVRAESGAPELIGTLRGAGFEIADEVRYYAPPAATPR